MSEHFPFKVSDGLWQSVTEQRGERDLMGNKKRVLLVLTILI